MKERMFRIQEIHIEEMTTPMGIDVEQPVFSWILETEENNMAQKSVRIQVGTVPGENDCWDSGRMDTDRSIGIRYAGQKLLPCTRYYVRITVCGQYGNRSVTETGRESGSCNATRAGREAEVCAEAETWFETGLMNADICAWDNAKWIGAPEYAVAADTISVFVLEASFRIEKGDRAGIVFGANDLRLMDRYKNESLLEGTNYITYVIDTSSQPANLEICRVGYAPEDDPEKPLYVIPIRDCKTGEEIITQENKHLEHSLKIEVVGNGAYTYLDGHRIDEDKRIAPYGEMISPRCLNPLGLRDVTTYPRLCNVGFYAGENSVVSFPAGLRIRNLRTPGGTIAVLSPEGKTLIGECQEVIDPSCHSLPMLRRRFVVKKEIRKARLYATARGIYDCSLNGKRICEDFFAPGASQYDHHLMYQTYDLTELLKEGENVLGCILASGWWSDAFSFFLDNYNYWGDKPSFLARMVLTYADGTEEVIVTDTENWEYFGEGPWRYAGFFNGEQYDSRREDLGNLFFEPGKDGKVCLTQKEVYNEINRKIQKPAEIRPVPMPEREPMFPGAAVWPAMNEQEPELVGNYQAPVKAVEILTAVSMTEPRPGVYIYDLGQEIAGVPVITLHEKAGHRVVLRYGEMLYPDLPRYKGLEGLMLQANLREAGNTDIYICSGRKTEVYQPRFTFHGYRYIEITGVSRPPVLAEVQSVLLSSVEKITGEFTCSDPLVNRFVKNVQYSQYNNFISIPTDCPQRNERMGWLGDTHVFCPTAVMQSNVKNFFIRNLQAMRDLQNAEGRLPSIAPFGGGFGGQTYESAMILIVWELYQQYGDMDLVREYYPAMDAWMDSMARAGLPGKPALQFIEWLGDWLAPEPTDPYLVFNAFHYRNACIMAAFAKLLEDEAAEKKYTQTADETKEYWNRTFAEPGTAMARTIDGELCDVQGSYAVALSCGVYEDKYMQKAFAHLARKTREADHTIHTGFFGTGPLNPMLSAGGYSEDAQKTITQTAYPGWLYPVTQGATTVWERWNSFTVEEGFGENNSMNSFDHYSLGSVVSWLYRNVLGIRRLENYPGYKHFLLQPETGTFTFAEGGIDTPHGRIESAWKKEDGRTLYKVRIPANTTCTLVLGEERIELGSGMYEFRR